MEAEPIRNMTKTSLSPGPRQDREFQDLLLQRLGAEIPKMYVRKRRTIALIPGGLLFASSTETRALQAIPLVIIRLKSCRLCWR
jgi:hypothetical protein